MATYELEKRQYDELKKTLTGFTEILRGREGAPTRRGALESNDGTLLGYVEVKSDGSARIQTENKEIQNILHRRGISSIREKREVYDVEPEQYNELRKILPEYELPDPEEHSKLTKIFTRGGYVTLNINEFSGEFLGASIDTADRTMKDTLKNMGVETSVALKLVPLVPENRDLLKQ